MNRIVFNIENPDFVYEQEGATRLWFEQTPQILTVVTFTPLVIGFVLMAIFLWILTSKKGEKDLCQTKIN
jgi:phage terminase large subunit-like protein